jgi:hypothetical protein
MSHRFVVDRPGQAAVKWAPPDTTDQTGHDLTYFGRALTTASNLLGTESDLTFVLTWNVNALPEIGQDVVAIVQGDEDARFPAWSNDVLITFKCYGTRPHWMPVLPRPGVTEALEVAHFARRAVRWVPGAGKRAWAAGRPWRSRPAVIPIPLGYYNQLDHSPVPFTERRWSVSFAGSGAQPAQTTRHALPLRPPRGTPKDRARAEMRRALVELAGEFPREPMTIVSVPRFPAMLPGQDMQARGSAREYSELVAQTRVCLVARGNSPETFRFFEALRAGCVVVCESLPEHWFYRRAPIVRLRHWDDLGAVLRPLLADHAALEERHRASVRWWESRCSEQAIDGSWRLRSLPPVRPPPPRGRGIGAAAHLSVGRETSQMDDLAQTRPKPYARGRRAPGSHAKSTRAADGLIRRDRAQRGREHRARLALDPRTKRG